MKVGERRQKNNIRTEQREGLGQSGGQIKEWEEAKDSISEALNMRGKKHSNRTVVQDGTRRRVFGDDLRNYYIFSKMI